MSEKYDLFISYTEADRVWAEQLYRRLMSAGVNVFFAHETIKDTENITLRVMDALEVKASRKVAVVMSQDYFDNPWPRAELAAVIASDPENRERRLIPLKRRECNVPSLLVNVKAIDFQKDDDFELRLRQLIEAIDLPRREFQREDFGDFREHELSKAELGRRNYKKGKRFEDEVAALYRVLGFEVKADTELSGVQIDLMIRQKSGGLTTEAIVECKDKRVTADERNQILAQQAIAQKKLPRHRWIAVSSQGFAPDTRVALEETGVDCVTYAELLRELIPLDNYADGLIADYEKHAEERWEGEDWFIRPDLMTDITYEQMPALQHLSQWLGEERRNLLVILGDLGTGKTTLAGFLAYNMARSFRDDPLRHPAPVLIPLKEVRKEISLESIVINHFARRGLRDINFSRFEHLVRLGKVVLFFDAFDEMADRIRWEDTQSNFRELSRAAELQGKIILTCRTHYFKDRKEQVKVIGEGPRLSETETDLYRELRQRSSAEVVFLQEFDDEKIQGYLRKARPKDHAADWRKIQEIWNLKDLATRPLLLDMIVKSMPRIKAGQPINAANLYNVYTAAWIDREEDKGRKFRLVKETKLALMIELAWRMWRDERQAIHYKELAPFVQKLVDDQKIEIGDEEIADIASEMQGASFLKRDDFGNFSFMHRSFGEFFVAKKINSALSVSSPTVKEGRSSGDAALADARATDTAVLHEALNVRRYDQKTIFFLSQLDEADAMREPLQDILRNQYQPNVSENALQLLYWSARIGCGMEEEISDVAKLKASLAGRIPANANLAGAKLQEIVLEGADLTGADLMGAELKAAKLNHATLDQASFYFAGLDEASIENAFVREADFTEAILAKVSFKESDLTGSNFKDGKEISPESFFNTKLDRARGLKALGLLDISHLQPIVQHEIDSPVQAVSYSPNGSLIAAGTKDGGIYLYRLEDGLLLRKLVGHSAQVNSVVFTNNGEFLASGSDDKSVKLWEVSTGAEIHSLRGHSRRVRSVAFSLDGQLLASGSSDHSVMLWEVSTGRKICLFTRHSGPVRAVAFSPDGKLLASGSGDSIKSDAESVKLSEVNTGKEIFSLTGHSHWVNSIAFSPDGKKLASGSDDNSVKLWEVSTGREICTLPGHSGSINSLAFSPLGKTLATAGGNRLTPLEGKIKLWDVDSHKEIYSLEGKAFAVNSIAFSPDGVTLALGSDDLSVRILEVNSGKEIRSFSGHSHSVRSVTFSPDGETLASGSYDKSVKLWQVKSGKEIRSLSGHSHGVNSVAFSPDGETLASGSYDDSVKLWQVKSGKEIRSLSGHSNYVLSVAFSPDGEALASGSSDNSVKLWQVKSGKEIRSLGGHSDYVLSVAFSPDGETLASGSYDKSVKLWQVKSGKEIRSLSGHSHGVNSVAFSPDGETLASGSYDKSVKLWQVKSGKEIRSLSGHSDYVNSVAFSPDGETIASGSSDNSVKLWQVTSGELLATLTGNLGAVWSVGFSPNGKYLVSVGVAGRLQFCDLETGQTFLYRYHFGPGAWLDLLPDGRFDASPEGMRYLGFTGKEDLTYYPAESLVKEFYSPKAVAEVLAKYTS